MHFAFCQTAKVLAVVTGLFKSEASVLRHSYLKYFSFFRQTRIVISRAQINKGWLPEIKFQ